MEPVKIITVIQEMVEIVQPLANERNLTIELLSSPSNQLFIQSDRQRLKQVLLNLLNNAIKYNRVNGSIQIKTEVMGENEAGIVPLRISVIDTGMGISAEDIPKLFRPFERIGAEKTETEGTGLGLAVVKKLMDAMGGHIEVESTLGIGSTFRIEFPVSENLLAGIEKNIKSNKSDVLSTNKNGTILYIEDNISNVELVKLILSHQRSGIHLITETNGRQAVPQAIKAAPDLILLDLDLPDIHGSEVIKLLQANEKTCNIPVVIISADAMPKQLQKLFEAGAKHYLTKPLDVTSFLKVIDEFVIS
jgi:CheY-like chemotaxis protein/two-component sensor histidine kinase